MQRHLASDIDTVREPQLRTMFETAAEVLGGLARPTGGKRECVAIP
jgi:hypothetical protein